MCMLIAGCWPRCELLLPQSFEAPKKLDLNGRKIINTRTLSGISNIIAMKFERKLCLDCHIWNLYLFRPF